MNHISSENLEKQIEKAIGFLKNGGLIAFPTDTVYGLGATYDIQEAVERIYRVKKRPKNMPLPLLLADLSQISEVATSFPLVARLLADRFFPGALTLVLPKSKTVSDAVSGGTDTVAVRIPAHPVPIALIRETGRPLVGTSANVSGRPSPCTAGEVIGQFDGQIDMVIDGGRTSGGIESTVVDVSGEKPIILRKGAVSKAELEKICDIV